MTSYVENETSAEFSFAVQEVIDAVAQQVLEMENCPYEVQINVLLTDNQVIREYNAQYRDIDRETDVLSFPNVDYESPSAFEGLDENSADYFDPDSGELILGDIILSVDKIREQAQSYGHSERRELAFLVAHSMLHLCGYDHMEPGEAAVMEEKQEAALQALGITRD
ncbi:MAG: rRNA maturation RNase YbeY [Lachnospiraceae bacterium]|nr:rRNA maturation RNase YbeY [Lachnospiraceae bacterium]